VRFPVEAGSHPFRRLQPANRIPHDGHYGNLQCRFRVSLSCVVGQVALELGKEQRLALVAMVELAAVVDNSVDMAAGPRMACTAPKVSSCSAFQQDLDQLVASVL
jgi:hypothetical protein